MTAAITYTVLVYLGPRLVKTIPGFLTRSAADARATAICARGLHIASVGSSR